jgi:hypothetical protein
MQSSDVGGTALSWIDFIVSSMAQRIVVLISGSGTCACSARTATAL